MGCKRDFPFQSRTECDAELVGEETITAGKIVLPLSQIFEIFHWHLPLWNFFCFMNWNCSCSEGSSGVDSCSRAPCSNESQCMQLKYGGFRCDCTGTGYYGHTCRKSMNVMWSSTQHNIAAVGFDTIIECSPPYHGHTVDTTRRIRSTILKQPLLRLRSISSGTF